MWVLNEDDQLGTEKSTKFGTEWTSDTDESPWIVGT